MRVKTPVFPYWVSSQSYTEYLGSTGNLTEFPVEFSLEDFGRYFWGVQQWRISGEFTYKIPDVVGVSWGPDTTEAFSVDLVEFLKGPTEVENDRVINSGYRFTGIHVGIQGFAVDLFWFRTLELNPTPETLWSGNHGAASGKVKPGFMLRVVFDGSSDFPLRELRTDMPVSLRLGEVDTQIADATIAGQSFEWHTGYNATPDASTCQMSLFTAELTPLQYFEFRDSDENNPVWTPAGTQLIDPRTT